MNAKGNQSVGSTPDRKIDFPSTPLTPEGELCGGVPAAHLPSSIDPSARYRCSVCGDVVGGNLLQQYGHETDATCGGQAMRWELVQPEASS